jgi:NADPH-dependent curcumin reductase CurA
MNDSSHVWRAERAASSLGCIGQDSLPTLLAALTNEASPIGYQAGRAIGRMGTNARPALPSLVGLLTITNRSAAFAAEILGDLKAGPELVVPALTKCLRDSVNPLARYSSARALGQFGGEARSAVPALLHAVNDPIAAVRREASNALQQIDPKALGRVEVRATGEGKKAE